MPKPSAFAQMQMLAKAMGWPAVIKLIMQQVSVDCPFPSSEVVPVLSDIQDK